MQQGIAEDIVQRLDLPAVGQMGYIVPDLEEAVAFCRDAFGIRPWVLTDVKPEPCIQRGEQIHTSWKMGFAFAGPVQIELIQVMEGETFHLDHIRESRKGPHHLGFMVSDLEKRLKKCGDMGIDVIQQGKIKESGFNVDFAYLDTVEKAGIVLELMRWKMGPVTMPVNRTIHNIVSKVGSWTLFRGRVVK
jgi:catechol 2,3-dioxygenase-like lactoylglutathione lyase family enzyme